MARVEGSVCAWLFPPTTVETHMCLTELELPNQHAQYFLPRTLRQSLSCVLIPFPCVLPGGRVEFCQWCALVRCSPFCLTFRFVPFAPRHHRTSHHGISTHLLHFGVTVFLLSPKCFVGGTIKNATETTFVGQQIHVPLLIKLSVFCGSVFIGVRGFHARD